MPNPKCKKVSGCGEWKRPIIENPAYKGKWTAPMIENPAYKGPWKAAQIPNPNYFLEPKPFSKLAPIAAAAIEVWTMSGGMRFDNIIVARDEAAVLSFGAETWKLKANAEAEAKKVKSEEDRRAERAKKRAEGGLNNMLEVYLADGMQYAQDNIAVVLGTLLALTLGLVLLCSSSGNTADAKRALDAVAEDVAESDAVLERHAAAAAAGPAAAADAAAEDEANAEVAAEDEAAEKAASKKKKK